MTDPLPPDARRRFLWDDESDAEALRMVAAGLPRSAVAKAFGISKNAVIGRLNRLRGKPKKVAVAALKPIGDSRLLRQPRTIGVDKPIAFDAPTDTAVSLRDARRFDCRWPMGDPRQVEEFRFCGARTHSGSFCEYHRGLAYQRRAA